MDIFPTPAYTDPLNPVQVDRYLILKGILSAKQLSSNVDQCFSFYILFVLACLSMAFYCYLFMHWSHVSLAGLGALCIPRVKPMNESRE